MRCPFFFFLNCNSYQTQSSQNSFSESFWTVAHICVQANNRQKGIREFYCFIPIRILIQPHWEFLCIDQLSHQLLYSHISTPCLSNLTREAFLKLAPRRPYPTSLKGRKTGKYDLRFKQKSSHLHSGVILSVSFHSVSLILVAFSQQQVWEITSYFTCIQYTLVPLFSFN